MIQLILVFNETVRQYPHFIMSLEGRLCYNKRHY
uniref:Uncharacterized protein n=1 Tax=Anguilla anguilla TaxID=7936 RepID=A0A0E9VUP3_ANGAN